MIFTESLVASLWPTWINTEVEYANNKYGKNNPQRTALNGGLSEGSSSYMDFMNYLGKAAIFTNQNSSNEEVIRLKAAQAFGKFLNVGTALINLFVELSTGVTDFTEAYNADTKNWIQTAAGSHSLPVQRMTITQYEKWLTPVLAGIGNEITIGNLDVAEARAKSLFMHQYGFVTAQVAKLDCMAMPGLPSGDAVMWEI